MPVHYPGRRYARLLVLGLALLGLYFLQNIHILTKKRKDSRDDFESIRNYERSLPQNSDFHPKRAVKFSNEVWGLGLNNQLHNRLVLSYLAYFSARAYVFQNVIFDNVFPRDIPLNTFISGPTAGGPFPRGILTPRSISAESWEKLCPYHRRTFLNVTAVNEELGIVNGVNGVSVLERWGEKLLAMTDPCVEITWDSKHIIDFYLLLWPILSTSPIITAFQWSSTVLNVVERNAPLITGRTNQSTYNMDNVLALHLRRGDFESHCTNLAQYASGYNSWNLLPELPDKYIPPDSGEIQDPYYMTMFMPHCWPSINDIVRRVNQVKMDHDAIGGIPSLDTIYILTNGDESWITELKNSILSSNSVWKRVTSSHDLSIKGGPEKVAAQAIDMAIASETGSLIGNGFSTLTANVVMLRLVDGRNPQTCRMW